MNARAITKAVQGSPQKARLVVDTIRGLRVPEALTILHFTNKRAAAMIEKTLRSAVANASNLAEEKNVSVDVDNLYVSAAMVDLGPTKHRRRRRPAPMGRAYSERRWRSSNITKPMSGNAIAAQYNGERGSAVAGCDDNVAVSMMGPTSSPSAVA